jgi:type IV pilus assembly protein PilQ
VCSSDLPVIIKKLTETNLIVMDGETIVISGLTKETTGGGDAGVPWLKDIPLLGYLVKADNKSDAMEEVLIFITPHILPTTKVDSTK